jgi:hypothetical protein
VLVQVLATKGLFIELAVALADDLVVADPDSTNLKLLASVLEKQALLDFVWVMPRPA